MRGGTINRYGSYYAILTSVMMRIAQKLKYIVIVILAIIMIGTIGFKVIGGHSTDWLTALYMTTITLTTVGYGDVIGLDHKPWGKVFTIIYLFLGTGMIFYLFTTLAAYVVEGEVRKALRRRSMEKRIEKMKNHYIVCGIGMVGLYVVYELHETKRHLVAIDSDESKLELLKTHGISVDMVVGDATENEVLESAMIRHAKGLFATTNSDNDNIVIALTAKQLNPHLRVVSRCNDTKNLDKIRRAGADTVVALNYIGGLRMASEMIRPHVTDFLESMIRDKDLSLRVEEVHIPKDSPFVGRPVADLQLKSLGNLLLIAIRKDHKNWIYNPSRSTAIREEMRLIVLATPAERQLLQDMVNPLSEP